MTNDYPTAHEQRSQMDDPVPHISYARNVPSRWPRLHIAIACVCGAAYLGLGLSTAEALYHIPGERYLFGENSDVYFIGVAFALLSPVVLIVSAFTQNRVLLILAAGLVVLAVVWALRICALLHYL